MDDLQQLVDAVDTAALLRAVDGLCAGREWDRLVDLARRCNDAVELGKQLWSVAMHIDYRLAWEGPARYAAAVLRPGAGRFALGPLTEVAASTHDWASLVDHVADPVSAATVAAERVLRGEDLTGETAHGLAELAELPLRLAPWEPAYALPAYRDRAAQFPEPSVATRTLGGPRTLRPGPLLPRDDGAVALESVVETWTAQSSGAVRAVVVDGDAAAAVGHLVDRAALAPVAPAEALALLQWAGASGGAHGRRPGGAAGRFQTWWTAAALAGIEWPAQRAGDELAADLGAALPELHWYRWAPPQREPGWVLRLAVADPVDGLAWAVDATDTLDDAT